MHTRTSRACLALSLGLVFLAPAIARADRTPSPTQIEAVPPPAPPVADPAKVEAKAEVKTETKVETKTDAKTETKKEPAKAEGGMCRVGATSGGWQLMVLALLGLRARRRRA